MRAPWKHRAKVVLDENSLEHMIKGMLSSGNKIRRWQHRTLFNEVTITTKVNDIQKIRLRIRDWLERITS